MCDRIYYIKLLHWYKKFIFKSLFFSSQNVKTFRGIITQIISWRPNNIDEDVG